MENKKIELLEFVAFANVIRRESEKYCHHDCTKEISVPNAKFLAYLYQHQNEDVHQKDLEEAFSVRPSTVSRSLKLLEEQGYVIRTASVYDSRLKKITLTEKSLKIVDSFENVLGNVFGKMTKGIPQEELDGFFETLEKMKRNLLGEQ
ncbi:MAG: winged helix-turn-helix transcriptional regulator [Ruminococcus sp.]|nr:winged helix-turn-helix transcriptional regulator [Ruminococcus sp.]